MKSIPSEGQIMLASLRKTHWLQWDNSVRQTGFGLPDTNEHTTLLLEHIREQMDIRGGREGGFAHTDWEAFANTRDSMKEATNSELSEGDGERIQQTEPFT